MNRHRAAIRPATILRYAPVAWLIDAGKRAAWTALAAILPLAPGLIAGTVDPLVALSVAALAALGALLTAVVSLPESVGRRTPVWAAVAARTARTAAQVALAGIGTSAVLLSDVDWTQVGRLSAAAAAVTLARAVMVLLWPGKALPETTTTDPTA